MFGSGLFSDDAAKKRQQEADAKRRMELAAKKEKKAEKARKLKREQKLQKERQMIDAELAELMGQGPEGKQQALPKLNRGNAAALSQEIGSNGQAEANDTPPPLRGPSRLNGNTQGFTSGPPKLKRF